MNDAASLGKSLPEPYDTTVSRIYAAYEAREENEARRGYLGPSALGNECDRALWYNFRWAHDPEKFSGRMLRLFESGHAQEPRMCADLRAAGIEVFEIDPATGEQWAVAHFGGHVRGHFDGRGIGFPEAPKTEHLMEFKTHNEKSFKELVSKGVKSAKRGHYDQMQAYMFMSNLSRAAYLAVNKNTDELYFERVPYDHIDAAHIMLRMEEIITAQSPPVKLHENPDHKMAFMCRSCPALGVCHSGQFAQRNCRTCLHSTPDIVAGGWHCAITQEEISIEVQRTGCGSHLFIPGIVPGEQIDADPQAGTVTYRMASGGTWVDGVAQ